MTRSKFASVALALSSASLLSTFPAFAGMTVANANVYRVALDPQDSNTLYAAAWTNLFKSTDQAKSWADITPKGLHPQTRVLSLAVNPQDSQTLYLGLYLGETYKSKNGGQDWELTASSGVAASDIVIDWKDPERVHVSGGGLYSYARSDTGGQDWTTHHSFNGVKGMAMDPFDSNTLYLALFVAAPPFGGLAKTVDAGNDWARPEEGLPRFRASAVVIDPQDSNTVYLGFYNAGLYKTTTGAKLWATTGIPSDWSVYCLAIDPLDSNTVYAGVSDPRSHVSVYKSTDGGDSWYEADQGITPVRTVQSLAIDPVDPNILYAGTTRGLFKSTDGAQSWFLAGQ